MHRKTLLEPSPQEEPILHSCRQNALQHIGSNRLSMAECHPYRRRSIPPSTKIDNERCQCICSGPFHTRLRGKSKIKRLVKKNESLKCWHFSYLPDLDIIAV